MIIDNIIKVKTNPSTYKHYISKGYIIVKCGEVIVLKKYGVSHHMEINDIKNRVANTTFHRYGVNSVLENEETRNKVLEYFGVENISQLESIKEIKRLKSIEKYGTDTPFQNKEIIKIIRAKQIENNRWHDYDLSKYSEYRKKVDSITKKNKKELFKKWNGYDYYDNEFIKNKLLFR